MKKMLIFIMIGYSMLSNMIIIYMHRMSYLPEPFNPAFYLHEDRRKDLIEIADYMRKLGIDSAFPSCEPTDPALEAMMKSHRLHKIELMDDGVVLFGAWIGRIWFNYYYGENVVIHVKDIISSFPERTYFRIDDHWYFIST